MEFICLLLSVHSVGSFVRNVCQLYRIRSKMIDGMLSTRAGLQQISPACMCIHFNVEHAKQHLRRTVAPRKTNRSREESKNEQVQNNGVYEAKRAVEEENEINCVIVARSYSISFDLRSLAVNV